MTQVSTARLAIAPPLGTALLALACLPSADSASALDKIAFDLSALDEAATQSASQ